MSLWDWAVEAYGRPDAEAACLALQDRYGQCVPFLLWAVWANPDEAALNAGMRVARGWHGGVIAPLRSARRAMKEPPFDDEALREEIKACELKAERGLLEALAPVTRRRKGEAMASLMAASALWGAGAGAPKQALQRLADAVSDSLPAT
ncbi:MAG TPA: TIGR02444 family protein [Caulobacteraceae bacterium]